MGAFRRQESLLDEKRDDPCAEEFLQRRAAHVGHHMEKPAVHEEPVGGQRVEVRVEVEVFAEGMNGHDDAGRALGQPERGAMELGQAAVGDAAEFLDEPAMKSEIRAQHLGDSERQVPVRHGRQDGIRQQRAEELHLFLVAGRAEPAALARERQQVIVLAVVAAHAGEAIGEIPATHELADHLRDDRAQEPEILHARDDRKWGCLRYCHWFCVDLHGEPALNPAY